MKHKEKIVFISLIIVFLFLFYFAISLKIDRSSVFPSHDKTLVIKNLTLGLS